MPSSHQGIIHPTTPRTDAGNQATHAKHQSAGISSEGGPATSTSSEGAISHKTSHGTHHHVRHKQSFSPHPTLGTATSQSTPSSNSKTTTQSAPTGQQHHHAQQTACPQHKVTRSNKQNSKTHLQFIQTNHHQAPHKKIIKIETTNRLITGQGACQCSQRTARQHQQAVQQVRETNWSGNNGSNG